MQRWSNEIDHFSSYDCASQSWYSTWASLVSCQAASTCAAVAPALAGVGGPSGPAGWDDISATFEGGLARAVLDEGRHPRRPVLRGEQRGEALPLDLQAGLEVGPETAVDRLLRGSQCERRAVGETAGPSL